MSFVVYNRSLRQFWTGNRWVSYDTAASPESQRLIKYDTADEAEAALREASESTQMPLEVHELAGILVQLGMGWALPPAKVSTYFPSVLEALPQAVPAVMF